MRFYYFVGQPGAGKTTLLRALVAPARRADMERPVPHMAYLAPHGLPLGAQMGRDRGTFSGTDALALSIQPKAVAWVQGQPYDLLIAEGDRLANDAFFLAVREAGYTLTVLHLATPDGVAAERRAARGSDQNAAWLKGRMSKVARLAETWGAIALDGTRPTDALVAQLTTMEGLDRFKEAA